MRIAELAARTGVAPRLLRYYEDQGLLAPARDARGWREYDATDQERVTEIRSLIEAGLPTSAIAQLIGYNTADAMTDELRAELRGVLDRLDSRMRCLARNRDALQGWLDAVPPENPPGPSVREARGA